MNYTREYNIFIIGAGFSAPADLPLTKNLWGLILTESRKKLYRNNTQYTLYDNILKIDIDHFIEYHNNSKFHKNKIADENEIDLEAFISYLDNEEYLHLLGSKHWSSAGNRSQIIIRNYIAKIIHQQQLKITDEKLKLYDEFVSKLKPNDLIITFNYDTIVEDALKRNNIPFRFYWNKLKEIDKDGDGINDTNDDEIILHKMHGSIDWVSKRYFISKSNLGIWNKNRDTFSPQRIIDEPFFESNELQHVYRIKDLSAYLDFNEPVLESPFIISPSFNKIVYLNPLKEFWNGFIGNGQASKRLVFIGFSLPLHDDYIRHPMYSVVKNFESNALENGNRISVVTFAENKEQQNSFKENYCFLDDRITDYYFEGFGESIIKKIFS